MPEPAASVGLAAGHDNTQEMLHHIIMSHNNKANYYTITPTPNSLVRYVSPLLLIVVVQELEEEFGLSS